MSEYDEYVSDGFVEPGQPTFNKVMFEEPKVEVECSLGIDVRDNQVSFTFLDLATGFPIFMGCMDLAEYKGGWQRADVIFKQLMDIMNSSPSPKVMSAKTIASDLWLAGIVSYQARMIFKCAPVASVLNKYNKKATFKLVKEALTVDGKDGIKWSDDKEQRDSTVRSYIAASDALRAHLANKKV